MAVLRCKMCGGDLMVEPDSTVCECEYCGTKQTIPVADDEKKMKLYERANKLRYNCDFDKAARVYESIVNDYSDEAEAYWGLILCNYGIEYVDDPGTGRKVPTCHRSSFDSVMQDENFELVMENADTVARAVYREEAKAIEEIRKGIIEVSGREEPYDIFICYKETDETGQRTVDSVMAQDIYERLTEKGYRVFFSRISLEDKLGTEYEPYIFAALNSAKVMLAFGTSYDYYNAVWVKNEWSRYLKLMAKDRGRYLIPCFKDLDVYDIPNELQKFHGQDMGKVGAEQDLVYSIDKLLGGKKPETTLIDQKLETILKEKETKTVQRLLKRAILALEDHDFESADDLFDRALDTDLENADAYFGKILSALQCESIEDLSKRITDKLFPDELVVLKPSFSVQSVLQMHFKYFKYVDPVSKIILDNTHLKMYSRYEAFQNFDKNNDYVKSYLNAAGCSASVSRLYDRYLEYSNSSESPRYYQKEKIAQAIEDIIAVGEKTYAVVREKCSEDEFIKVLNNIEDPMTVYNTSRKKVGEQKINNNQEKIKNLESTIEELKGFSNGKKRKELQAQINEIKKENLKIQEEYKKDKTAEECVGEFSIGSYLRKQLVRQGYIEELPELSRFTLGRWRILSKEFQGNIHWTVMDKDEEGYVLLLSEEVLDIEKFADKREELSWENSALRRFLNQSFYKIAFNPFEKSVIVPVCMDFRANQSEEKADYVFCLNSRETDDYVKQNKYPKAKYSVFVEKKNGKKNEHLIWLRNGGTMQDKKNDYFMMTDPAGEIKTVSNRMGKTGGVRPALWIDIS